MHRVCIESLLVDRATRSVDNALSGVDVAGTVLNKHASSTPDIVLLSSFPVSCLGAVNIHIILRILHVLESSLV